MGEVNVGGNDEMWSLWPLLFIESGYFSMGPIRGIGVRCILDSHDSMRYSSSECGNIGNIHSHRQRCVVWLYNTAVQFSATDQHIIVWIASLQRLLHLTGSNVLHGYTAHTHRNHLNHPSNRWLSLSLSAGSRRPVGYMQCEHWLPEHSNWNAIFKISWMLLGVMFSRTFGD